MCWKIFRAHWTFKKEYMTAQYILKYLLVQYTRIFAQKVFSPDLKNEWLAALCFHWLCLSFSWKKSLNILIKIKKKSVPARAHYKLTAFFKQFWRLSLLFKFVWFLIPKSSMNWRPMFVRESEFTLLNLAAFASMLLHACLLTRTGDSLDADCCETALN